MRYCGESLYHLRHGTFSHLQEKVHMVRHQAEAIEGDLALAHVRGQMLQIVLSVFIVVKDILPIIPPYDDMKQCPGVFDPWFSSHKRVFSTEGRKSQK